MPRIRISGNREDLEEEGHQGSLLRILGGGEQHSRHHGGRTGWRLLPEGCVRATVKHIASSARCLWVVWSEVQTEAAWSGCSWAGPARRPTEQ